MIKKFVYLYIDGFKNLSPLGKKLWLIIIIKLFIMFFVLKLFFFPNKLGEFEDDRAKVEYIYEQLTNPLDKHGRH